MIDEIEKVPIQTIISQLAGKLRHDDFVPMTHLSCNLDWVESYLTTMTHQQKTMHTIQQLHFNIANMLAEIVEVRYARSMR